MNCEPKDKGKGCCIITGVMVGMASVMLDLQPSEPQSNVPW